MAAAEAAWHLLLAAIRRLRRAMAGLPGAAPSCCPLGRRAALSTLRCGAATRPRSATVAAPITGARRARSEWLAPQDATPLRAVALACCRCFGWPAPWEASEQEQLQLAGCLFGGQGTPNWAAAASLSLWKVPPAARPTAQPRGHSLRAASLCSSHLASMPQCPLADPAPCCPALQRDCHRGRPRRGGRRGSCRGRRERRRCCRGRGGGEGGWVGVDLG